MTANDLEKLLKTFGLRKYETEVYVGLMKSGPLSAREVAELTGVPNPRIYSILDALKKMGYVNELQGKPSLYDAQHPRHILQTELAKLRKRIDIVLEEAEQDYEIRKDQRLITAHDMWTIYGGKGMVAELLRLVAAAKKEIVIMSHDLEWCLEESIIKLLRSKRRDRVITRVIGTDADLIKETAGIFQAASGGEVRLSHVRSDVPSFAVVDENELLVSIKKTALIDRDDYVSVTIRNYNVARLYREHFEHLWEEAKTEELI